MQVQRTTKEVLHKAVAAAVPVLFMMLMRCGKAQTITEPSSDKVTNLCTEAKYTEYLANHIVAEAEEPEHAISIMQIYGEAWNLLAASTNQTDKRAATYALATYMSSAATQAKQLQSGKYRAAVLAATYLQRRSALTRTLQAMRVKGRSGAGQVNKQVGVGASCSHKETPTLRYEGDCGRSGNVNIYPESIAVNLRTATHIKLLNSSKLRPLALEHSVNVQGLSSWEETKVKAEGCRAVSGNGYYAEFVASTKESDIGSTVAPIRIFTGGNASANCAVLENAKMKSEKDNDLLINKICNYIKKPDPHIINVSSLTPAMLANTTAVRVAFRSFIHAATGKAPSDGEIEFQLKTFTDGTSNTSQETS
ncbi:variant surface glycoprotein (VSG, atypical) [Trypanosoma brucei gambiense DAL972]|uniref:Variant surface glycoprotein (VSG, atypical) n=1 Tax=Trypanosoma brucei gambiense (strain MHOM/CI/86/DAL972) TaxID=679716 RepID=C9ZMI7_TRYB9|nr:variant surface glycoprotein (VSG, atypical) [Trypanosoma brucei gambiense DAL972]CBH10861.1 variant surface glycoprotein (VSG, atypical) [Trypanosoma brucei gambiense DAL972]|eukprot:XP_011773148.1 variant surface glycoprotein (VSG, atypical) [Trypanosoma brucei gambiense DAL972]